MGWFSRRFETPAAATDGEQEPAVELEDPRRARRGAWAPRALCVLLAACGPELGNDALTYDARTGYWDEGPAALEVGDEYLVDGHLYRVTADGVEDRGVATVDDLAASDETWVAEAAHRVPGGDEWVLVLGAADDAGHWRLAEVEPGERFAFQGWVFNTADADGDGRLELRATGDVIGRVVNTFVRHAPEVIDAEITYADGSTDVLTGTPNHPFWVDAVRDYVPLGELRIGTQLHVQGGGAAILVSKTWRQGDFEVFDFEVEGLHNFYVRGSGSDAAGVLVHNSTASKEAVLKRPYIRKPVRAEVEARAPRDASGRPIDPNTGAPIEGKPDLGHKPGHEFRREKAAAEAEGLTQKEFDDKMNDPDLYQLEDSSSNRSHKYEQKP
jgi:HNH/ENDO VII superfamily nuclease with conserved GHE residues/Pretoxin HINT domain